MTQTKHAAGPWEVFDRGMWDISVVDGSGGVVCHISNKGEWFLGPDGSTKGRSHNGMLKHAHLIAAAPDMLEALRDALPLAEELITDEADARNYTLDRIRAAIAKAEGRS